MLDNSEIKCWGRNFDHGQLGQGHTNNLGDKSGEMGDNLPPIDLGTGRTALQITTGGLNTRGELGQEHTDNLGDEPGEMGDNLTPIDLGPNRSS